MSSSKAGQSRLRERICLAQDSGLVLGVEPPPYGLRRHCRIRSLLRLPASGPLPPGDGVLVPDVRPQLDSCLACKRREHAVRDAVVEDEIDALLAEFVFKRQP